MTLDPHIASGLAMLPPTFDLHIPAAERQAFSSAVRVSESERAR